jgi:hypothetical protein
MEHAMTKDERMTHATSRAHFRSIRQRIAKEDGFHTFLWFGSASIATFFSWPLLLSVVCAPACWIGRRTRPLPGAPSHIGSWRNPWALLQQLAMNLEGYRFAVPLIPRTPSFVPTRREQRAPAMRNAGISGRFGDVAETFSKIAVTAPDLSSLFRSVEADESLVHAAYFH